MVYIVPDLLLEKSVCSNCDKYLSVLPVTVLPNRNKICGRCVGADVDVRSNYNRLAELMLFKCVNRYEGCYKLLLPEQVREHEKICQSNEYDCPLCAKMIPSYAMMRHFNEHHGKSTIKNPEFKIDVKLDTCKTYLYYTDMRIFFVHVFIDVNNKLCLKASCLGPREATENINYTFHLTRTNATPLEEVLNNNQEICLQDEKGIINCELIINYASDIFLDVIDTQSNPGDAGNLPAIPNNLTLIDCCVVPKRRLIFVDDHFFDDHAEWELSECKSMLIYKENPSLTLTSSCSGCGFLLDVYHSCNKNHLMCTNCFYKCNGCNSEIRPVWKSIKIFSDVFKNLKFFCKWKCQKAFSPEELNDHELNCTHRDSINCFFCGKRHISNVEELKKLFLMQKFELIILKDNVIDLCKYFGRDRNTCRNIHFYMDDLSEYIIISVWKETDPLVIFKKSNFTKSNLILKMGIKQIYEGVPYNRYTLFGKISIFNEFFLINTRECQQIQS